MYKLSPIIIYCFWGAKKSNSILGLIFLIKKTMLSNLYCFCFNGRFNVIVKHLFAFVSWDNHNLVRRESSVISICTKASPSCMSRNELVFWLRVFNFFSTNGSLYHKFLFYFCFVCNRRKNAKLAWAFFCLNYFQSGALGSA